jgi:DNA helicase-2/ATP-dependent DNA helicase PcrA
VDECIKSLARQYAGTPIAQALREFASGSSLDKQMSSAKKVDRDLMPFYARPAFEPESRITTFDRMRLHYVAFSRPEKVLVLTTHGIPKDHFAPIWQGLPQWPYVSKDLLASQSFAAKQRYTPKRTFSFTGDLKLYETCPRRYDVHI